MRVISEDQRKRNREAWEKMRAHLLKQRRKSQDGFSCLYRGPDGTKCAVGCLIADEDYRPAMEREVVGLLDRDEIPGLAGISLSVLQQAQRTHDHSPTGDWRYQLQRREAFLKREGLL